MALRLGHYATDVMMQVRMGWENAKCVERQGMASMATSMPKTEIVELSIRVVDHDNREPCDMGAVAGGAGMGDMKPLIISSTLLILVV